MLGIYLARALRYKPSTVHVLRCTWLIAILWFELATFHYHVSQCFWPTVSSSVPSQDGLNHHPTRVLLVSDPQVLDHRSYPDRAAWLTSLSQYMVDLNMRKSWWATKKLNPDVLIFLGDMMDGGRFAMPDAEYESYYNRFRSIFRARADLPTYYIPGNHDVGLGTSPEFSNRAGDRYTSHFGSLNQRLEIANHTFVLIDAPALVEEDRKRIVQGFSFSRWAANMPGGPIEFVQESSAAILSSRLPSILLTHIPLARPNGAPCGPGRERGSIRGGAGYGYENTLSPQASQYLLQSIRPALVFSGDDHDYCEYFHPVPASEDVHLSEDHSVKEVTVKAFSMAMGIRKPGFQLLSLVPPEQVITSQETFADMPCILPDQLDIYLSVYVPLLVFSIVLLFLANVYRVYKNGMPLPSTSPRAMFRDDPDQDMARLDTLRLRSSSPFQALRKLDIAGLENEDGSSSLLPPPTPGSAVTGKHRQKRWKLTASGWTLDLSSVQRLSSCLAGMNGSEGVARRARAGLVRGFLSDVLAVAWTPIVLFVAITWWTFQ